jgi:hypothetical protein
VFTVADGLGTEDVPAALGASGIPYFSRWESAELAERFVDGSLDLADDPWWAASGARTPGEYRYWARKVCGLACLKMILARRRWTCWSGHSHGRPHGHGHTAVHPASCARAARTWIGQKPSISSWT